MQLRLPASTAHTFMRAATRLHWTEDTAVPLYGRAPTRTRRGRSVQQRRQPRHGRSEMSVSVGTIASQHTLDTKRRDPILVVLADGLGPEMIGRPIDGVTVEAVLDGHRPGHQLHPVPDCAR